MACAAAEPMAWGLQASVAQWTGGAAGNLASTPGTSLGLHVGMPSGEKGAFRGRLEWRNPPKDRLADAGHLHGVCLGVDYLRFLHGGQRGTYGVAGLQYGSTFRTGSGGQGASGGSSTPSGLEPMAGLGYRFSRLFSLETSVVAAPVAGGKGRAAVFQVTVSLH